jgi:cGMP-dependent protein kinase
LLYNAPRSATVTAVTEVKCVSLGRDTLNDLLGSELQQIIYRNSQRMSLEQNEILSKLSKD